MKVILLILLLAGMLPVSATELIQVTENQRKALQIKTAALEVAGDAISASLPAEVVVPNSQLHIVTAPLAGMVETLLAAEGDAVDQALPIARIQSPALLELQGEYLEVRTRHQLARSHYKRDQQLNREGIIAERRLLESAAQFQELATVLARVKRLLELAGMDGRALATLGSTRKLDSTLVVTAPFDGVVLEQMTTAGSRVEAADPLYRIASLKPLWLEIHVPLEQLADINPGQMVIVPSVGVSGPVITIGKLVHGVDQGVLVRAEIVEGAEKLRPGQFLQAQLAVTSQQKSYRVPRAAVIRSGGDSYVLLEQRGGFQPLQVSVLSEESNAVVIKAELPAQTRIAVTGTVAIKAIWLGAE